MISRNFLAKYTQLTELTECPGFAAVGNVPVITYGVCPLYIRARDYWGYERTYLLRFVVADIEPFTILLGQPWLEMAEPHFDFRRKTWTYPDDKRYLGLQVEPPHSWTANGFLVAAVVPCIDKETTNEETAYEETATLQPACPTIPTAYEAYKDLFSSAERLPLPRHTTLEHRIDLDPDAQPPWGPIYPLGAKELDALRKWLAEALEKQWIQPSVSPAGAPIMFVPKKGGELRLVVDYRALNHITRKNRAPLPLIGEILDRLATAKIFTKLDLKDAYYRIRIRSGDEWKTAFRTRYGHFEFLVMPMGLANAPATFQTYINQALAGLVDVTCIVYLDDILIFSNDEATHEQHVREVLERLKKADLYVNLKKCQFHTTEVSFLGFVVSPQGIAMEQERIEAIAQWPLPRSVHDIQVFLGFTGFYRRFIRNYSKICAPLTDLLRGDQSRPFNLTDSARKAFEQLQRCFQEAPILRHFDPALPIRVEADASNIAIGAVLSQLHDGHWHPVAFRSRKLTSEETRYSTGDGELLGLIDAFRTWRHYLLYSQTPVIALTDHLNLESLKTKKRPSPRQLRWSDELAAFDFIIKYRPGSQNPADGLSRRPDHQETSLREDAENPLLELLQQRVAGDEQPGEQEGQAAVPVIGAVSLALRPKRAQEACASGLRAEEDAQTLEREREERSGVPLGQEGEDCSRHVLQGVERGKRHHDSATEDDERAQRRRRRDALPLVTRPAEPVRTGSPSAQEGLAIRPVELSSPRTQVVPRQVSCVGTAPDHRTLIVGAVSQQQQAYQEAFKQKLIEEQAKDPWVLEGTWKRRPIRWKLGNDGILRYRNRTYVPATLRQELLLRYHDAATAGHGGIKKTRERLTRHYYWNDVRTDVEKHINKCATCGRTKPRNHRPYGELAALPIPERPWQIITVDFVTGLPTSIDPRTNKPCNAVLVIVDKFTKYALYVATTKQLTASAFAHLFFEHVYRHFGLPDSIVSDRGSLFTSKFWETICGLLGIERRLSTAYHPQTDGQTERQNQNLEHYLRIYCSWDQADWAQHLALAEHVYNNSLHTATKATPAALLYGFQPRDPDDLAAMSKSEAPAAGERIRSLLRRRDDVRKILAHANEGYEKWYNKGRTPMAFKAEDWVWLSSKYLRQKRPSNKLADKYLGPFKIIKAVGDNNMAYQLDLPASFKTHTTFPISLLEPFKGNLEEALKHRQSIEVDAEERHYDVETILDHRGPPNRRQFLIKWKGYPTEDNSWEPREYIDDGPMIQAYEARIKTQRRTRAAETRN
jgi:transposase InsO family protein